MTSISIRRISNKSTFGFSILLGVAFVVGSAGYFHWKQVSPDIKTNQLIRNISVTEQIQLDAIPQLKRQGYATIIDLRPDGEAADQPSSGAVDEAARNNGLHFAYVPVSHGEIPDSAVIALDQAIANSPKPILLYCRSGRRAARTWSLVEASRPNGLDEKAILAAVNASGQSAEDLTPVIAQRIANRIYVKGEVN